MSLKPEKYDVVIIGGGLAGLCSAIHLSRAGVNTLVIERNDYPKHKVCGEYISNEVLPYLKFLGIDVFDLGAKKIDTFQMSTRNNKLISTELPLGGFGISRYCLDHNLAKTAEHHGAKLLKDSVENVTFDNDEFTIQTKKELSFRADFVLGAYGKRSNLDIKLNRQFIKRKAPYLAVKTHVKGDFPENMVALHNFEGGYCGVSKVENDHINLCYITNYKVFQKAKNIPQFEKDIVLKNKFLRAVFRNSEPVFEKPLTISQISFEDKKPVENHILMIGDTAALIHPLCGNGMSMAIRSAEMVSRLILKHYKSQDFGRYALEKQYLSEWNAAFRSRLNAGHQIARLFNQPKLSEFLMSFIKYFPWVLPKIIKRTHGEVMVIK